MRSRRRRRRESPKKDLEVVKESVESDAVLNNLQAKFNLQFERLSRMCVVEASQYRKGKCCDSTAKSVSVNDADLRQGLYQVKARGTRGVLQQLL